MLLTSPSSLPPSSGQALRREELPGRFDLGLLLAALALASLGVIMVASSSIPIADPIA